MSDYINKKIKRRTAKIVNRAYRKRNTKTKQKKKKPERQADIQTEILTLIKTDNEIHVY